MAILTQREFWSQRPALAIFETITFEHPDLTGPVRLVANQFSDVVLGGASYRAASMAVSIPGQGKDPTPKLRLTFPRIVAGREFTLALRQITDAGKLTPISVTYKQWQGDNLATPVMSITLYVNDEDGVTMDGEHINVTATDDNPMRRDVSEVYDVAVFTGLEQL